MEILDYLFEKSKPPVDEGDMPAEASILADYDAIRALLTFTHWNGEPRQLSSLRITYQKPDWVATLVDTDNERSLSATGKCVATAIESLNKYLLERVGRWYYWPSKKTQAGNGKYGTLSRQSGARTKSRGTSK